MQQLFGLVCFLGTKNGWVKTSQFTTYFYNHWLAIKRRKPWNHAMCA